MISEQVVTTALLTESPFNSSLARVRVLHQFEGSGVNIGYVTFSKKMTFVSYFSRDRVYHYSVSNIQARTHVSALFVIPFL